MNPTSVHRLPLAPAALRRRSSPSAPVVRFCHGQQLPRTCPETTRTHKLKIPANKHGSWRWTTMTHQLFPSLILRIRVHGVLATRVTVVLLRRVHRQRCLGEALWKRGRVKQLWPLAHGEAMKERDKWCSTKMFVWKGKKRPALFQNLISHFAVNNLQSRLSSKAAC